MTLQAPAFVTAHALVAVPLRTVAEYERAGGFSGLRRALDKGADATVALIGEAGVRGRGGGGFATAVKWASLRSTLTAADEGFIVVNAAEGEPGTFKDRSLLRRNPFLVLEGALIAAVTLGVDRVVVATKAKYRHEVESLHGAIEGLASRGWLDDISIEIVEGPDHYLFGEETAMLEVIEGEDPLPRHLPPYQYGLFTTSPQLGWSAGSDDNPTSDQERSNPALVNNVETYAHVALVCRHGAAWYRSMGTQDSPGPTIVTLTGDVAHSAVAEIGLGVSLAELIDQVGGGTASGRPVKAVLTGVSNPVLSGPDLDAPITYEHLQAAGGGLGSAGFIVFDDSRNMVDVAYQVIRFLHVESCGQCNPCKTGTGDIAVALESLVTGVGDRSAVAPTIARRLETVTDASRCYLPSQAKLLIASLLQRFPDDLARRLGGETGDASLSLPQLVDIVDGVAILDDQASLKRPDWTIAETPVWLAR